MRGRPAKWPFPDSHFGAWILPAPGEDLGAFLGQAWKGYASLRLTLYRLELSHMATPNFQGGRQ